MKCYFAVFLAGRMHGSMSLSPRVSCMGGVVVVREQFRLHGAPHRLRVYVFLRVLHAFWGLLRRVQVLFLLDTVLSRLILSRYVWSLHRHVSSASLLHLHGHHSACDTHISLNSYSVHVACGVQNSENSLGDTEAGGQRFCVPGGTKSLSTRTRCGVRRSAVYGSAWPVCGGPSHP